MDNQSQSWQVWLIVIIFGMGAMATRVPLKSPRPENSQLAVVQPDLPQAARARMWEDPLVAAASYLKTNKSIGSTPQFSSREDLGSREHRALSIIVPGGPYASDAEWRARMRYAAVMALLDSGYKPIDADKLGAWQPSLRSDCWAPVAFEEWANEKNKIVLLWISEENLLDQSKRQSNNVIVNAYMQYVFISLNERFGDLTKFLFPYFWQPPLSNPVVPKEKIAEERRLCASLRGLLEKTQLKNLDSLHVIGPATSDGLKSMQKDSADFPGWLKQDGVIKKPDCVEILSPFATVMPEPGECGDIKRTIAHDGELADILLKELQARDAIPDCKQIPCSDNFLAGVVLISEYDTEYGRGWPQSFEKSAGAIFSKTKCEVKKYFYLRGLDGFRGDDSSSVPDSQLTASPQQTLLRLMNSKGASEKPFGPAQLDYVRRLATTIEKAQEAEKPITAIGICGTDVFDKLLLLQGLRESFPGRVFFTTDLNAALLMPDQYRWTRNLVVASAFDLELGQKLQKKAPPFRDCYQTSLFLTVKRALPEFPHKDLCENALKSTPRIYEIGRSGARDLSLPMGGKSHSDLFPDAPEPLHWLVKKPYVALLGSASLLILLICIHHFGYTSNPGLFRSFRSEATPVVRVLGCCVVVGLIFYLGSRWIMAHLDGKADNIAEPFALLEGISIWPSQAIRAAAFFFAIFWSGELLHRWYVANNNIEKMFFIPPSPRRTIPFGSLKASWISPKQRKFFIFGWHRLGRRADFMQLWTQYRERGSTRMRAFRAFLFVLFFFAASLALFRSLYTPPDPIRGDFARNINCILLYCSVFAVLFLNFLVWDSAILCTRFIHLLTSPHRSSKYPARMLGFYPKQKCDVRPSLLDTRIVSQLTESVGRAIYFPLLALFLMVLARCQLFDNWQMSLPLVIVLASSFLVTILTGLSLRNAAEKCRKAELGRLKKMRQSLGPSNVSTPEAASLNDAIAEIAGEKAGAFGQFREDPILRPLLIPVSGTAALLLIDYFGNHF